MEVRRRRAASPGHRASPPPTQNPQADGASSPQPELQRSLSATSREVRSSNDFRLNPHEPPLQVTLGAGLFVLIILVSAGVHPTEDSRPGVGFRRAMWASLLFLVAYSLLNTRDGVLENPSPALWRMLHGCNLWYCLLVGIMFALPTDEGEVVMTWMFPGVDRPTITKQSETLGFDHLECKITLDTVWRQFTSIWFPAHCIGWFMKMLMLRDLRTCLVYSSFFELTELTLQFLVPEFQECWWDSLIMDWLLANFCVGMCLGRVALRRLNMTKFDWHSMRWRSQTGQALPSMRLGVRERLCCLFPGSWSEYEWNPSNDPVTTMLSSVIWIFMAVGEVNSFFLINILHLPRNHLFNVGRQAFLCMTALPATEEWYEYTRHARARWLGKEWEEYIKRYKGRLPRIGHFMWLMAFTVTLETAAVVKYSVSLGQVRSAVPGPETWMPWAVSGALFSIYFMIHCWFFYCKERHFPMWLGILKWVSPIPLLFLTRLYAF